MTTNGANTLEKTNDGKKFLNSDGKDVKQEVKSMLGTFGRIWKTVAQKVQEMVHPLTVFSPEKVVTVGGTKYVRIPPSVDECNQHRDAYSVRMEALKMEWNDFTNTVKDVINDSGVQMVQFKALPVGREKEALEEIVIKKGFIVIAWTLEGQPYADGTKRTGWGLMDVRHLDSPRFMSQGTVKLSLEVESGEVKQFYPTILLQDEIIDQDDQGRSTAFYVAGVPPGTASDGEILAIIRTGMQDVINGAEEGKSSKQKKALRAFTVRRWPTRDGTRVYAIKTADKAVRDELRNIFVGGTEKWSGGSITTGGIRLDTSFALANAKADARTVKRIYEKQGEKELRGLCSVRLASKAVFNGGDKLSVDQEWLSLLDPMKVVEDFDIAPRVTTP